MGTKKHRMTIGLDREDIQFLKDVGVFGNTSERVRWCIKFVRVHGIPLIRKSTEYLK